MQHLDEGTIHAWLDGELPLAEGEAAAAHVAQCEQCAAAVAEARGFIAASSRILTALDAVPGGVLPAAHKATPAAGVRAPVRFRISRAWMAAAAVLVLSTVTVIVIRPRRDLALRVAEARKESNTAAIAAPAVAQPLLMDTESTRAMRAPAAVASAPPPRKSSAKIARARVPAEDAPVLAGEAEDKLSARDFAARKDERAKSLDTGYSAARAAAPPPSVAQAPAPAVDSVIAKRSSALQMSEVVVTGAGTTTSPEKLKAPTASDAASPRVVSRRTSTAYGDTAVTTVYDVQGMIVTLIDRSAPPRDLQGATANDVAPRAQLQAQKASAMNSITWSDSTGHLRTLRGPASVAELTRLRAALFGPTP